MRRRALLAALLLLPLSLSACAGDSTVLNLSFQTADGGHTVEERPLYAYRDMDTLRLYGTLALDAGEAKIAVLDTLTGDTLYAQAFDADGAVLVEVQDVHIEQRMTLRVEAEGATSLSLVLTSVERLDIPQYLP